MINFKNTYNRLPSILFKEFTPYLFPKSEVLLFNQSLAKELNLELSQISSHKLAQIFTAQKIEGHPTAIAQAYSGHQFGHFNPTLGDGRAALLGEILDELGNRRDLQIKGSGPTYYSRGGDGMLSLGPAIREYIVSEAMSKLVVPTTRSLAICLTGQPVYRESTEIGATLTRIASSHIRIGTFEFVATQNDKNLLEEFTDYTINRHYPDLLKYKHEEKYLEFIEKVAQKQAYMVSRWMSLGFIHGVMNTDNMTITGETIDYGPCAFLDNYIENKSFSYIDRNGRYRYGNQIEIAKWNLYRLASTLIPLIHEKEDLSVGLIKERLNSCLKYYDEFWLQEMSKKFGISNPNQADKIHIENFLQELEKKNADFTQSFSDLTNNYDLFYDNFHEKNILDQIKLRQNDKSNELMKKNNPYLIPRNHQIEKAIKNAYENNFQLFHQILKAVENPFILNDDNRFLFDSPTIEEIVKNTFCGT